MESVVAAAAFGVVPAVAIAVAATIGLAWAWHGRPVDEHPMCRRCGFSLNGRTRLVQPACPDCGTDLERPRAVRIGHRRKRPALLALALSIIIGSTAWIAVSSWTQAKGAKMIHHAPTSWLLGDADGHDPRARDAALAELARRVARGQLSRPREQALVEQALASQADWARPWAPGWGDVVEAARMAGRVSNEQWARYQVQSVSMVLEPEKATLRRADDLVLHLFRGPDRVSSRRSSFDFLVEAKPGVSIAGREIHGAHEVLAATLAESSAETRGPAPAAKLARMRPINLQRQTALKELAGGEHPVKVSVVIRPVRIEGAEADEPAGYTLLPGERHVEVAGRFVLREEGPSLDELVGPEWKGVWVPPEKREALMRAHAKRKEARRPTVGQPTVGR